MRHFEVNPRMRVSPIHAYELSRHVIGLRVVVLSREGMVGVNRHGSKNNQHCHCRGSWLESHDQKMFLPGQPVDKTEAHSSSQFLPGAFKSVGDPICLKDADCNTIASIDVET